MIVLIDGTLQMFADIAHFVHLSNAHHFVGLYSFTEDDTSGNVFGPDNYQRDNTIKGVTIRSIDLDYLNPYMPTD